MYSLVLFYKDGTTRKLEVKLPPPKAKFMEPFPNIRIENISFQPVSKIDDNNFMYEEI